MGRFKDLLEREEVLILHGALGTELEFMGFEVAGKLWSAQFLVDQPQLIQKIHETYLQAEADIITSSSYQASVPGLMEAGFSEEEAAQLIVKSMDLTKQARESVWRQLTEEEKDQRAYPLLSGCVGPYAAYLANASEYTGYYGAVSVKELKDFHRNRTQLLLDAGAELLCLETIPNLTETIALCQLLTQDFPQAEAYISFTAQEAGAISDGTDLATLARLVNDCPQILALGFNCSQPLLYDSLLAELRKWTDKPFVTYPNSGEIFDTEKQDWTELADDCEKLVENTVRWQQQGSKIIGGCCRTRPAHIASLARHYKER